jgi:hypothetical protein
MTNETMELSILNLEFSNAQAVSLLILSLHFFNLTAAVKYNYLLKVIFSSYLIRSLCRFFHRDEISREMRVETLRESV